MAEEKPLTSAAAMKAVKARIQDERDAEERLIEARMRVDKARAALERAMEAAVKATKARDKATEDRESAEWSVRDAVNRELEGS